MTNDNLYCCKIKDESATPETTTELLHALEFEFSSWIDKEGDQTFHTIYAENAQKAEEAAEKLRSVREDWKEIGIEITEIETLSIKKEDWSEVWKKYFKIKHCGKIVIKPTWLDYDPQPEETVVELDPGMSFGTGHHPTTSFCLRMLGEVSSEDQSKSFLEAGCGSGILSIAAFKLGFKPLEAFDIDPDAVRIAGENFQQNNIAEGKIKLSVCGLEDFSSANAPYDLVAANILSHILMTNRKHLVSLVKPGGKLILAGILTEEYQKLKQEFCSLGLEELENFTEKEWTSGIFRKNS
jgi:ribosomal protein L11 methyltransferase